MKLHAKASLLLAAGLFSACASTQTPRPDFYTAVEHHLSTVETRDLSAFTSTLTETDDLYVIFPNGSLLNTTEAVADFHKEWFADAAWVFDTEIVKVIEGADQSTALVKHSYRDSADGPPRDNWLVLVFQLEDGAWKLIHDQNTRISE